MSILRGVFYRARADWIEQNGVICVGFYGLNGEKVDLTGINLVPDQNGDWSDWMTPVYNTENSCITFGNVNLGEKEEGDWYSCQLEIEFKNVSGTEGQEFRFRTQGAADKSWQIGNIWGANLVWIGEPLEDGIYKFTCTSQINSDMAKASFFEMGFRCDNWASGSFRVRKIKIEKGNIVSEWSPGV